MKIKFSTPLIIIALLTTLISCQDGENPFNQSAANTPVDEFSAKQELIETVDNLMRIADYALSRRAGFLAPASSEDTVYVRGKADGSIETEKHTTTKGAPLISVKLTRGNSDLSTVTITRTYDSEDDFTNGVISSEKVTTIIGLASGQIKTTVLRNDTAVYNTFKTPVVTVKRDITTIRQGASDGSIEVVRTRTDDSSLISRTLIYGRDDGAILTKRIYADLGWEIAAVKGRADSAIEKTITISDPTAVTLNEPTDITDSSVTLSWSENTDDNFGQYEIYQSQFSGVSMSDALAGTVEEQSTTLFTVEDLASQTTYYLRVYVINDVDQAAGSNEVNATTE